MVSCMRLSQESEVFSVSISTVLPPIFFSMVSAIGRRLAARKAPVSVAQGSP